MSPKDESHNDLTPEAGSVFQPHPPAFHLSDGSPTTVDPNPRISGASRRQFMGWVLAGSTLVVAGRYVVNTDAAAAAEVAPGAAANPTNRLLSKKYRASEGA